MIRKCLFPAAGYGTRFLPATKAMPKQIFRFYSRSVGSAFEVYEV